MLLSIIINQFKECTQCGECCEGPCELIPSNIPDLLNHFNMNLSEFFKKYLIVASIGPDECADETLMMFPVKCDENGKRINKYFTDEEYLETPGKCIFLNNNKCSIHSVKPFGGAFGKCYKMTESFAIRLPVSGYFAYWYNNQHIFEELFPGYKLIADKLKPIYKKMNDVHRKYYTTGNIKYKMEYEQLARLRDSIKYNEIKPHINSSLIYID